MNMEREITWVGDARKRMKRFPVSVQNVMADALEMAALGEKHHLAKPMKGLGSGVFEIAKRDRGDAYRAVYAVQLGKDIFVMHAFQKKSSEGTKTPKKEIDLIKERMRKLKAIIR